MNRMDQKRAIESERLLSRGANRRAAHKAAQPNPGVTGDESVRLTGMMLVDGHVIPAGVRLRDARMAARAAYDRQEREAAFKRAKARK